LPQFFSIFISQCGNLNGFGSIATRVLTITDAVLTALSRLLPQQERVSGIKTLTQ
jgi:hypothetical protein